MTPQTAQQASDLYSYALRCLPVLTGVCIMVDIWLPALLKFPKVALLNKQGFVRHPCSHPEGSFCSIYPRWCLREETLLLLHTHSTKPGHVPGSISVAHSIFLFLSPTSIPLLRLLLIPLPYSLRPFSVFCKLRVEKWELKIR